MSYSEEQLKQLVKKERYLKVINRFAIQLLDCQSVEEVLWSVAKNAIAELGYEDCVIYLFDDNREFLVQRAAHGPKNPIALDILNPILLRPGEGIVGHVALTGMGEIVKNTREDSRYVLDDDMRLSEIAVPIKHNGEVIGIIDSEHQDEAFYPDEDLDILTTIASMTASKLMQSMYNEQLKEYQHELEDLVNQRTTELQKTLLEVEEQKSLLSIKNKDLMDSLNYAQRIQSSILPSDSQLKTLFTEYFVFYRPKDIVSGDFYWVREFENHVYFSVADCTGHGVPGALLSLIGYNALSRIVSSGKTLPSEILEELRKVIVSTLNAQDNGKVYDGMDIGLCVLDRTSGTLRFAGANQSAIVVRGDEIIEMKGERQSIGFYEEYIPINVQELQISADDMIYLFSDGFKDQFGGPQEKKFKFGRFRDLLKEIAGIDPLERESEMEKKLQQWKGELEQLDDICVLGIKF